MAGLVAAGLSLVVIVAIAPALSVLPRAVLSAIIVNAVWNLIDVAALRRYARVRRNDIVAAVVAAVGVLVFGPLYGLLLAVAQSLLGLVYRLSRVDVEVMGKVPHEKAAWGSTRNHDERTTFPGVMVLRLDAPFFWVTAAPIHDTILTNVDSMPDLRALVLDMEATNQMDTTSVDALADLLHALRSRDIDLYLVRVMWPVRKLLRRSGLMAQLGEDHVSHSISQGVRVARRAHGLKHLPVEPKIAGVQEASDQDLLGEAADEEHIAARNPDAVHAEPAEQGTTLQPQPAPPERIPRSS
jgi:anti-anti-sigma factor